MRIISWNVNGLRAIEKKGHFLKWLNEKPAAIIGLQEVRAFRDQMPSTLHSPTAWHTDFSAAKRPGYSGVALYSQRVADEIVHSIGREDFDLEGRVQLARFGKLLLANVYFPNGGGKEGDNSRIPFKLDFYQHLFQYLDNKRKEGMRVLVMGDFNTAHQEIDLARPKENEKTSGFCANEREELDRWLKNGYTDTFRHFYPDTVLYSWWSQRMRARERNVGWRIDYVLASQEAMPFVKDAFIWPEQEGSDHCPVGVDVDDAIML